MNLQIISPQIKDFLMSKEIILKLVQKNEVNVSNFFNNLEYKYFMYLSSDLLVQHSMIDIFVKEFDDSYTIKLSIYFSYLENLDVLQRDMNQTLKNNIDSELLSNEEKLSLHFDCYVKKFTLLKGEEENLNNELEKNYKNLLDKIIKYSKEMKVIL